MSLKSFFNSSMETTPINGDRIYYEKLKLIDCIQMDEELFHCLGSWIRGAASNENLLQ